MIVTGGAVVAAATTAGASARQDSKDQPTEKAIQRLVAGATLAHSVAALPHAASPPFAARATLHTRALCISISMEASLPASQRRWRMAGAQSTEHIASKLARQLPMRITPSSGHSTAATLCWVLFRLIGLVPSADADFVLLKPDTFRPHFVEGWPGPYANGTGAGEINETSYRWTQDNLPLFECSDVDMQSAYYFRAKTYHSHMNPTLYVDQPLLVSEFGAAVHWGGPYGTINAAAGHHISEGRWIRDDIPMNSDIKFWLGSMSGGNEALTPHYANGTRGKGGSTPYSEWIVTAVAKRAHVQGFFGLGADINGETISMTTVLDAMVGWWEKRTLQTRLDCVMARQNGDKGAENCASASPGTFAYPFCYIIDDGWDAMEGSVSGDGCRPTIGAMKYGDAMAIAELAKQLGNFTLAEVFMERAVWIQQEYLKLLWNEKIQFFAVYKENLQNNSKYHCIPGADEILGGSEKPGCPISWPCNTTANVRELLGLGPPYYFEIVPQSSTGPTKYDAEWKQLDDPMGFRAQFGPTTVERRSPCFNQTQDQGECNWAGPSWPYETSRVLTGLANFLIDYPSAQSAGAGVSSANFTRLLRTYAITHTRSSAANGTRQEPSAAPATSRNQPWVGENIEPDKVCSSPLQ